MANIVNNVDLDKISQSISNGKKDTIILKKPVKLHGEWNFDRSRGDYQFKTELSFENGRQIIEIDSPSFLGGNGSRLSPMAYCVAGITSCFIATFVSLAAGKGVKLTKLVVDTECTVNFSKTFDISNDPITEGIKFQIDTQAENADKQTLQDLVKMAEERCPAMYSMLHEIKVDAKIK